MQEMKHELEMMKLQHEIDTLQREIDTSMPRRYASTPFVDGRSVTFGLPYEPSRLTEETYQQGMTPFPTVPQLPGGKRTQAQIMSQQERSGASKRPVNATVVGEKTADTTVQKKQRVEQESRDPPKKKISIECEGDIRLNLGALVGEECVVNATDVSVEMVNGKLRVEVKY